TYTISLIGQPRDFTLHVRPECVEQVLCLPTRELSHLALVMAMETVLAEGLFVPEPACAELHQRLGDVLILPYLGNFIWWREPGVMQNDFYGHHGGLTREETVTVVGAIDAL